MKSSTKTRNAASRPLPQNRGAGFQPLGRNCGAGVQPPGKKRGSHSQPVVSRVEQALLPRLDRDDRKCPANLDVRAARPDDVPPLQFFFDTALRRDYFLRRGQIAEMVADRSHQVYVAELDSVLVGVAVTTGRKRLVNALVHPAYRGLGIGRALVNSTQAAEVRAKLDMSSGDPRPFYQRLGFTPTGVRNKKGNIEILKRPQGDQATK